MKGQLKNSEKRNAILAALKCTKTHPSADWIYERVKADFPEIGIATVYRNLKLLLEQNMIFKVDVGDGLDHYDAQTQIRHDHTYCTVCGAIGDIDVGTPTNFNKFESKDFSVESYSTVLFGKCRKCALAEAQKSN